MLILIIFHFIISDGQTKIYEFKGYRTIISDIDGNKFSILLVFTTQSRFDKIQQSFYFKRKRKGFYKTCETSMIYKIQDPLFLSI